jgi:ERCC4-type nuclease
MVIQIDSREKARAITKIVKEFDTQGVKHFSSKLPVGDYMSMDNARFVIDRKQSLLEVCTNVCQDHKRFINELKRAKELGIKIVFLVEHGRGIRNLGDIPNWKNPRLKDHPLAVSGPRLYEKLYQIEKHFDTKFYFCSKNETGKMIISLLGENYG